MEIARVHFRWKLLLIPLVIITLLFLMYKVPNTVLTFIMGLFLYMILDPMVDKLENKFGMRPLWTVVVLCLAVVLLISFIIPLNYLLINEAPKLAGQMPNFIKQVKTLLLDIDSRMVLLNNISGGQHRNFFSNFFNSLVSQHTVANLLAGSTQAVMRLMTLSFSFVMALIIAVYLILDEHRIMDYIESRLPKKFISLNRHMWHDMMHTISGYLTGLVILGVILFAITWIGLSMMHVNYALLLSIWSGITIIIPYLGPFIGGIPAVAVAMSQSMPLGIIVAIFITILQFIVTSVIGPKVLGEIIGVHPVIVILSLIAGGELGGMVGMVVAVPLTSIIFIFFRYYWSMFTEN